MAIRLTLILAGLSACAMAQVQIGDVSLTGTEGLSAGYSADFGDSASSHGLAWGSQTTLTGSYYAPQFVNFTVVPYFNQSRANSDSLSVSNASGVNADVNLFSGSHVPITFDYAKSINSTSNYNFGQTSFAAHGNSTSMSVGASPHFAGLPSLIVLYQQGNSNADLYGSDGEITTNFHTFLANSSYRAAGFQFAGGFQQHWADSEIPNLFSNAATSNNADSSSYSASVSHNLPMKGDFSFGYEHERYADYTSVGSTSGAINFLSSSVSFHPRDDLQFSSNMNFNDNLVGVLQQSIQTANGIVIIGSDGLKSNSLLVSNLVTYTGIRDVGISGGYVYAQQDFAGVLYTSQSLNANTNYVREHVLGGRWNASFSVSEELQETNQLGYRAMSGWTRHFGRWNLNTNFSYDRNTRAQLIRYTSSGYSYSGSLGRKVGKFYWNASASIFSSKFDQLSEFKTTSRSYASNISGKYGSIGGAYTQSSGNSFLSSAGLTANTLPASVLGPVVLFDGNSYSISGSVYPRRGFDITGSYSKAKSSTSFAEVSSWNATSQTNLRLTYLFRKVSFTAGYTNLNQDFTMSPTGASSFSTYFFGLSRYFNLL